MEAVGSLYTEKCHSAGIEPRAEFLQEINDCIEKGKATLDVVIDGGVRYNRMNDREFIILLEALRGGGSIRSLCVPRNDLTDAVMPQLAKFMAQSDSLLKVDISANQITAEGVKPLEEVLQQTQSLTHFIAAQNELLDEGCMMLILSLRVNRTITHLNLSDTGMTHNALTVLGSILADNKRLLCVHVDNPHFRIDPDNGARRMLLSLKVSQTLTELSLSRAGLGDDSAVVLSEALADNHTLLRLRLMSNSFSSVGAEVICKGLLENDTLEVLDLSGNRIGDIGATGFGEAFPNLESLKKLDLSNNSIKGVGLQTLCVSLEENSSITDLCLWGNSFVDDEVLECWDNLIHSTRGESLSLDFEVHHTDGKPYLARTSPAESPHVWD